MLDFISSSFFFFSSFNFFSFLSFFFFFFEALSLTHPVLVSFLSGEFLLHIPCWLDIYLGSFSYSSHVGFLFIWGVFLTHTVLVSFFIWEVSLTYPMLASWLSGEFLLHIPCWLHLYLGSFSYTSHTGFFIFLSREFLLHIPY